MKYSKFLKRFIFAFFAWFLFLIINAGFSWSNSYFRDMGARPTNYTIDKRSDKTSDYYIKIISNQPEPEHFWLFGHLWIEYKQSPNNSKSKQFGYYSLNQTEAAIELALSLINPFGFVTGQKPIKGELKSDDIWHHHTEIKVLLDKTDYDKAIETHKKWEKQTIYINRAGIGKQSFACADYAFDIAKSIGLKVPSKTFGKFPPELFWQFGEMNGLQIKRDLDLIR